MRTLVTLACTECKRRNYTTKKNKQNNPERIEYKKYCKWCRTHHGPQRDPVASLEVGRTRRVTQASSSIGRAPVSKTGCWGFESLLACH